MVWLFCEYSKDAWSAGKKYWWGIKKELKSEGTVRVSFIQIFSSVRPYILSGQCWTRQCTAGHCSIYVHGQFLLLIFWSLTSGQWSEYMAAYFLKLMCIKIPATPLCLIHTYQHTTMSVLPYWKWPTTQIISRQQRSCDQTMTNDEVGSL